MTPDQRRIAVRVARASQALVRFNEREPTENERDPLYRRAVNERDAAFTAAIKAELLAYPSIRMIVWPWLETLRRYGERGLLRRIRRGLDTKVSRPLPLHLRPTPDDARMIALHRKGYSLRRIASELPKLGIKHMSHVAVGKRLARCGSVKGKLPGEG